MNARNAASRFLFELRRYRAALKLLEGFLSEDDLVFDVGANVGLKTHMFLSLGATVVAFEPQAHCRAVLLEHFRTNSVTIDPRALSDRDGTAILRIPQVDALASVSPSWIQAVQDSGRFAKYDWRSCEAVPTARLDTAISDYGEPTFCKIDVEGNEEAVINGLSVPLRALSLEFTPEHRHGLLRAVKRLASLGDYEWNFVRFASDGGDPAVFEFERWLEPDGFSGFLSGYDDTAVGDAYARLRS